MVIIEIRNLRTPCYTKEQISDFTSSLYKYFYERVKDSIGYKPFLCDTFGKCVNAARHSLGGGHEMDFFEVLDGQFSHADMLVEIMGSADELYSAQDFYKFQIRMLKRFRETLDEMFEKIKKGQIG